MKIELLHKFFKGECSPKEAHEILVWINSPEGEKEFHKMLETFEYQPSLIKESKPMDSQRLLSKVHDRIREESLVKDVLNDLEGAPIKLETSLKMSTNRSSKRYRIFSRIAAAVSLLLSVAAFFYLNDQIKSNDKVIFIASSSMQTKATESGQKLEIHLNDGSVAILNANSSITYPREFSDTVRLVQMKGEVFFEVAKNKEKPFIVQTSKLNTTALGTSFNIQAYDDTSQEVSLITGKVKVESFENDLIGYLNPGEAIQFNNGENRKTIFDPLTKVLWTEGIIYFNKTSLSDCFKTLEQWYGVKIEIDGGELNQKRKVSGKFDNDYLTNVLNSISYAHQFKYEIHKERVHITFLK